MKLTKSILGLAVMAFASIAFAQDEDKVSIESLLNEMVNRDAVARFPSTDFRLKQESSYNRASKTPADTVGWFTNRDFNTNEKDRNFIRIEEKNGQKEWVLMDHTGPGAIVRTWMPFLSADKPNTDIQIRIYLDGNPKPALEGNMLGLLDGSGLIPYPLAHQSLRSAVSFFPIPYAKSCKITTDARPFFYQFTYRAYDEDTAIKTFTKTDFGKTMPLTQRVGELLLHPKNRHEGKQISFNGELGAKEEKSITLPSGNAAVRELSLQLADYKNPEVTRSVVLKMEFDGMQTVWTPIGDFFGSGIGLNPFQGWYRTVSEDGTMTCRWTMPYQKSGKISVVNLGETAINIDLKATVGSWKWDSESMYFNAAWRGQYPVTTRPFLDWNYVTLKGRGVYVGDALTIMNPVERWWGEGDEKIWVDGEDFPSIFGTGTEDYYAYSWGGRSTDFYEHPFHAQPKSFVYNKLNRKISKEKNTLGYSTETRSRALDVMPFSSALQLDMEVWSWTDCEMGYGVGVYWYGDKQTTSNRFPDEKEVLNIPPLPKGYTDCIKVKD
ncbi:glycoside hydrolase family 172 protein [Kriegella aquimaris]|nr:glycoside hydrolase family 172 protein [Kriegella aquimaris]